MIQPSTSLARNLPGRRRGEPWQRLARLLLLAPLVALASGCASYMSAEVTTFHQLTPEDRLVGRRFAVEPTKEQQDSLEFRAYADLVRQALVRQGLVAAPDASAELGVAIRYSVDSGRPVVYSYPAYGYASYGPLWGWGPYPGPGGTAHYVWGPTYPFGYGAVGTSYAQSVVYRYELGVDINNRRATGKAAKLFEGRVVAQGESASLAPVIPAMVRALFSDFPGPNGVTRRVQIRLDEDPPDAPPPASQPSGSPSAAPATEPAPEQE
jgi:hypothetical protein